MGKLAQMLAARAGIIKPPIESFSFEEQMKIGAKQYKVLKIEIYCKTTTKIRTFDT